MGAKSVIGGGEGMPHFCDAEALKGRQVLEQLDPSDEGGSLLHRVSAGRHHDLAEGVPIERPADTVLCRPHGGVPPLAVQERQLPKGAARGILENLGFWPAWGAKVLVQRISL